MVAGLGADSMGALSESITLTLGPVQSTLGWIANERENRTASSASRAAVVASSSLVRRRARYPRDRSLPSTPENAASTFLPSSPLWSFSSQHRTMRNRSSEG